MCGLFAMVSENTKHLDRNQLIRIRNLLLHRGPDDSGYIERDKYTMIHTRLAIIDVENGHQPMSYVHHGVTYDIVYNGMLYNYKELREELERKGYIFRTQCDTEVVLVAFIEYKEQCVYHFNGIYAFVIASDTDLFAARDPFGVKPLYYYTEADTYYFASEMKLLIFGNIVEPTISAENFTKQIAIGPSLELGDSVFENIQLLEPGTYLYKKEGTIIKETYFSLQATKHTDSYEETKERLQYLLEKAIRRQCTSDVSICSMLSGGLDSSLVSKIACEEIGYLNTYSLSFNTNDATFVASEYQPTLDNEYVRYMSEAYNFRHKNVIITQEDTAGLLKEALFARDYPGMADIDSSMLYLCKSVVLNHKVVLTGECADEVFGGYPWFYRKDLYSTDSFPWLNYMKEKIALTGEAVKHLPYEETAKKTYQNAVNRVSVLDSDSEEDIRVRRMTTLSIQYFMQTLLLRMDAMSSAVGLEARVPFADIDVVNYVYNIPWHMKYANNEEKGIIRDAFEGKLLPKILHRKKSPFPKTHDPRYSDIVIQLLERELHDGDNSSFFYLFDKKAVEDLIATKGESFAYPWYGQLMRGPQMLAYLYQYCIWLKHYNIRINV